MGFQTFKVILDPEQPVYLPGQEVKGYLRVISTESVSCRAITVTIKGHSKVHWSEKSGKNRRHYRSAELYFRNPVTVWRGDETDNSMRPCNRTFNFCFNLPRNIPSSFTSPIGKVIYQVKGEADRPWARDQTHKVFFSVNFMYDLNLDPMALVPIRIQKEKTLCCLCCSQGPIELNMTSQRSGYVPGECIVVDGEVINHSNTNIKYTEIKLIQVIKYITKSKSKVIGRTMQRLYHPQLPSGETDKWSSVPLLVPPVPASHLRHCNIITIDYIFNLVAKVGLCRKATAMIPIIIGSLPLQTTYSTFLTNSQPAQVGGTTVVTTTTPNRSPRHSAYNSYQPSAPPQVPPHQPNALPQTSYPDNPPPYNASFLPEEYREVPPPSYASCVFGMTNPTEDEGEDSDTGGFEPRYFTYRTNV